MWKCKPKIQYLEACLEYVNLKTLENVPVRKEVTDSFTLSLMRAYVV
jgi:hypothetical protein